MVRKTTFKSIYLFFILESNDKTEKTVAAVLIRKLLEIKDDQVNNPNWGKLSKEDQEIIKKLALTAFINETDASLLPKVTECLIQISTNVFNIAPSEQQATIFPDLFNYAIQVLSLEANDENIQKIENGLRLFEGVYGFIYESLSNSKNTSEIHGLLEKVTKYTQSNRLSLASKAVKTISEMSFYASKKELKSYKELILPTLTVTYNCLNANKENELKTCLKAIIEMCTDSAAFLFKNHFSDLFILMGKISEKKDFDDDNIRELGFEVITNLVENKPIFLSDNKDKLSIFVESIFKYALEMEDEITEDWTTPSQSSYFDEEFIYEKEVASATSFIERLIDSIGEETLLPIISRFVSELIEKTNDWRYKYVGIMIYKTLITHVDDMVTVDNLFPVIFQNLQNENSKIRYACISTIEELADTFQPHFSQKYYNDIIPILLNLFNDSVLKVQLESCEALNTLMTHCDEVKLSEFSQPILDKMFGIFLKENLPNNLRECLLNVLSTLVSQIGELFKPYASKCLGIICDFFSNSYKNKVHKPIYGNLMECITIIGQYDEPTYYKLVPDLVYALIEIQDSIHLSSDPLRDYIQDAIERLVRVLKKDFKELLPKLIESVMKLVKTIPEMSVSSNPEENFKIDDLLNSANSDPNEVKIKMESNVKTSSTEEMASALETLNKVMEGLDTDYYPFIELTNKEIIFYLNYLTNEDLRQIASDSIPLLINIIKKSADKETLINYAKYYTSEMMKSIENEIDNETLGYKLENFIELIETVDGFLVKSEINQFFERILIVFDDVEQRRLALLSKRSNLENQIISKKSKPQPVDDDEEDNDDEMLEKDLAEEIEDIEDIQGYISDLIGKLFATHKNDSQDVVAVIISKMIPKYFRSDASIFENKMGMYLIDDIVEFLGQDYIDSNVWNEMAQALNTYATHQTPSLRQPALYGIGMFAKNTTKGFENYSYEFINKIVTALNLPSDNVDEEDWGLAKDNAVAALGRIIKYQNSAVKPEDLTNLLNKWLNGLPITVDDTEMIEQHEFLCDCLLNKPELIVGNNYENGIEIVKILGRVYKSKFSDENVNNKIKDVVEKVLKVNTNFQNIITSLSNSSDEKIVKRVKKLLMD